MPNKLTVCRTTYGVNKHQVIMLSYHDGGEIPTFEIVQGRVSVQILEAIERAIKNGFEIEFENQEA